MFTRTSVGQNWHPKDFIFRAESQGRISFDIVGSPDPYIFNVARIASASMSKAHEKPSVEYKTSFHSQGIGKGRVSLHFENLQPKDRGQYVLEVSNGIQPSLEYVFNISIIPKKPQNLQMTIGNANNSDGIFNFCNPNTTFGVTCHVPTSLGASINDVTLHMADVDPIQATTVSSGLDFSNFHFLVSPSIYGNVSLECRVLSDLFLRLVASVTRYFTIQAPPKNNVEMSINGQLIHPNDTHHTLVEGQPATITCHVQGGYPAQVSLSLKCNNQILATHYGNRLEYIIDITNFINQHMCSCRATHLTGCYNQTSETILNVKYKPILTSFTVYQSSTSIEIPTGSSVPIVCSAYGNPAPEVTIKMIGANDSLPIQTLRSDPFSKTLETTKSMTCSDLGVYECVAANEMGSVRKTVEVFVQCKPEIEDFTQLQPNYIFPKEGWLRIVLEVSGYPPPQITMVRNSRSNSQIEITANNQDLDVDIAYLPLSARTGQVILNVSNFKPTDEGQYDVIIDNGLPENLNHTTTLLMQGLLTDQRPGTSLLGQDDNISMAIIGSIAGGFVLMLLLFFYLGWGAAKRKYEIKDQKHTSSRKRQTKSNEDTDIRLPNVFTLPPAKDDTGFTAFDNTEYCGIDESTFTVNKGNDVLNSVLKLNLSDCQGKDGLIPRPQITQESSFDNDTYEMM